MQCGWGYTAAKMIIDGVETMVCRVSTAYEKRHQNRVTAIVLGTTLPVLFGLMLMACFCVCRNRGRGRPPTILDFRKDASPTDTA